MKKEIIALIFGIVFTIFFLWQNLFWPAVNITPYVGTNDFTDSFYPQHYFYAESFKKGEFSYWASSLSSGFPFYAAVVGSFYPVNWLFVNLTNLTAVNWLLALNYFLIFVFAYLYLRQINFGVKSSLIGSTLVSFSGFAANQILYHDTLATFYLFLLELLLLEKFLQKGGRNLLYILLTGFVLGLQILAGHPQYIFYGLLFLTLYFAYFWFKNRRPWWLIIPYFTVILIIGILIGSVQLWSQIELTANSTRSTGLSTEVLSRYNLPFSAILTLVFPFAMVDQSQTIEAFRKNGWPTDMQYLYMSLLGLVFVILGLIGLKRFNKYTFFFFFASLGSIIFSFGSQFPVVGYLLTLPPFSFFRIPFKIIFIFNFALAVLAAFAYANFNKWLKKNKVNQYLRWAIFIIIALIILIDLRLNAQKLHPPVAAENWFKEPEVVSFIKKNIKEGERVTTQQYYYPSLKIFLEQPKLWQDPKTLINLRNLMPAFNNLLYDIPLNVGMANAGGLKIRRFNELEMEIYYGGLKLSDDLKQGSVSDSYLFLNRIMSVRYAIFAQPVQNELLKAVYKTNFKNGQDQIYIYEFTDYFPRTFMVPKGEITDPTEIKKHLLKGDFNPKDKVYLEEEAGGELSFVKKLDQLLGRMSNPQSVDLEDWGAEGGYAATAIIQKYANSEVELKTSASGDGFLYLSDPYYPSWKAFVDGNAVKIYRANYAFRAVAVPQGEHLVTFRFQPSSFYWGVRMTLVAIVFTILSILLLLILKIKKNK